MRGLLVLGVMACGRRDEPAVLPEPEPAVTAPRPVAPPTRERADAFAREFADALRRCAAKPLVDYEQIVLRGLARHPQPDLDPREIAKDLGNSCTPGPYKHIATHTVAAAPRPVIRIADGVGAIDYLELELDDTPAGIRVVDMTSFASGEPFSETSARVFAAMPTQADKTLLDTIQAHVKAGRAAEAAQLFETLPARLRDSKPLALKRLAILARLDGDDYRVAAESYAKKYPGDPSLDMMGIRVAIEHGRFEAVTSALERLAARVDNEPYLDVLRAQFEIARHDPASAIALANRATRREPDLAIAWRTLLYAQILAGKRAAARATLEILRTRFGELLDNAALRADPIASTLAE